MTPFPNPLISYPPQARIITSISNAQMCVVTTSQPHGYVSGLIVRIVIPYPGSMPEVNGNIYFLVFNTNNSFFLIQQPAVFPTLNFVNSTKFTPFVLNAHQVAQVIPVAEEAGILTMAQNIVGPNNPNG